MPTIKVINNHTPSNKSPTDGTDITQTWMAFFKPKNSGIHSFAFNYSMKKNPKSSPNSSEVTTTLTKATQGLPEEQLPRPFQVEGGTGNFHLVFSRPDQTLRPVWRHGTELHLVHPGKVGRGSWKHPLQLRTDTTPGDQEVRFQGLRSRIIHMPHLQPRWHCHHLHMFKGSKYK